MEFSSIAQLHEIYFTQLLANNFTSSKGETDVTAPSGNKHSESSEPQCV